MGAITASAPSPFAQCDARSDRCQANAQRLDLMRGILQFSTDDGEEVGTRRARFDQVLVAVGTVVADRRPLDEHLGPILGLLDRLDDMFSPVNPAVADLSLDLGVPAPGEDVLARQVDNRVASIDRMVPRAFLRRVALNDLNPFQIGITPGFVRPTRKNDGEIAAIE